MRIETQNFGEIEYEEEQLITFEYGLPGFPDDRRFLLIPENEPPDLFYWLQSVDDGNVAFTLLDVYQVMSNYNPLVEEEEIAELGDLKNADLKILNIVVIPDDVKGMRVNLKAPVCINMVDGIGKQVIVNNDEYPIQYLIFDEIKKYSAASGDR